MRLSAVSVDSIDRTPSCENRNRNYVKKTEENTGRIPFRSSTASIECIFLSRGSPIELGNGREIWFCSSFVLKKKRKSTHRFIKNWLPIRPCSGHAFQHASRVSCLEFPAATCKEIRDRDPHTDTGSARLIRSSTVNLRVNPQQRTSTYFLGIKMRWMFSESEKVKSIIRI